MGLFGRIACIEPLYRKGAQQQPEKKRALVARTMPMSQKGRSAVARQLRFSCAGWPVAMETAGSEMRWL